MRYALKLMLILMTVLLFSTCEDDFDPKGDFRKMYVLNAVIRADTAFQIATVHSNYDVQNYDPYTNTIDPVIKDAYIRIWDGDAVYTLKDTSLARMDTSRYSTPAYFYFVDGYKPAENHTLEIEALLNNGKRLRSVTKIPNRVNINTGASDLLIPPEEKSTVGYFWSNTEKDLVYHPRLSIFYYKKNEGSGNIRRKEVPIQYSEFEGSLIALHPKPFKGFGVEFQMDAVDRAMAEISEGDENKNEYYIVRAFFELIVYDKNLSGFYLRSKKEPDSYSIRLDESDFSNIDGGLGVFGSYNKSGLGVLFTEEYIRSFGYKPDL